MYYEYNSNNNQKQYCNIMIGIFCFIPTILSYMYLCRLLTFVIKSKFIISKTLSFSSLTFLFLFFGIYYIYFISFKFTVSIREKNSNFKSGKNEVNNLSNSNVYTFIS